MRRERRVALIAAVLCTPLTAAAVLLIGRSGDMAPAAPESSVAGSALEKEDLAAAPLPSEEPIAIEEELEKRFKKTGAPAERADAAGNTEESAETIDTQALLERTLAESEPVARRFFDAYSLYEIARSSARVEAELTATATSALRGQLLGQMPPRIPATLERPPRASIGALQIRLAGSSNRPDELGSIDLLGEVRRSDERHPIAFEMLRDEAGEWRVAGLGR